MSAHHGTDKEVGPCRDPRWPPSNAFTPAAEPCWWAATGAVMAIYPALLPAAPPPHSCGAVTHQKLLTQVVRPTASRPRCMSHTGRTGQSGQLHTATHTDNTALESICCQLWRCRRRGSNGAWMYINSAAKPLTLAHVQSRTNSNDSRSRHHYKQKWMFVDNKRLYGVRMTAHTAFAAT